MKAWHLVSAREQPTKKARTTAPSGHGAYLWVSDKDLRHVRADLTKWVRPWGAGSILFLTTGCSGMQSALDPAGEEAAKLAQLFWWMVLGTVLIWIAVAGLTFYAVKVEPDPEKNRQRGRMLIVMGGAVVPTIVLTVLLIYGLSLLPPMMAPAPEGSLKIRVAGELWWWRVLYSTGDGREIELANEIRLPVGEPVQFELSSSNVIHAFWIPPLGGKRDMIPGRVNKLALKPTKTGVFRGVCAEYCGTSHALMTFYVEVMEKEAFEQWLEAQAKPARTPNSELAVQGERAFQANGCGACHMIRGTEAKGVIGPDLTHLGSRMSLGAGIITNDLAALERWIAHPERVKPGVHMPGYPMLPLQEREAIAAYLKELE